jgi:hypothetical protein
MTFSKQFFKLLLGEPCNLLDLIELSPAFGGVVLEFQRICLQKASILSDSHLSNAQKKSAVREITYQGKPIEDLYLNFRISEGVKLIDITTLNKFKGC